MELVTGRDETIELVVIADGTTELTIVPDGTTELVLAPDETPGLVTIVLAKAEDLAAELSVLLTADDAAGAATETLKKRRAEK